MLPPFICIRFTPHASPSTKDNCLAYSRTITCAGKIPPPSQPTIRRIWCEAPRRIHQSFPLRLSSAGCFLYVSLYATSSYHCHSQSIACMKLKPLYATGNLLSRKSYPRPQAIPINLASSAHTHAITHCPTTTPIAHFPPSSLLTEATAATQGV